MTHVQERSERGRISRVQAAALTYVIALVSILYPTYGPGGTGTGAEVLALATISLVVLAVVFFTPALRNPVVAATVGVIAFLAAWSGTEWTGVPVVLGSAAAWWGHVTEHMNGRSKASRVALISGGLALLSVLLVVFLEPVFD